MIFEFIFYTFKKIVKMKWKIFYLGYLLLLTACLNKQPKNVDIKEFSKIKVESFRKKNVSISTSLRYFNDSDLGVKIDYAEFDVLINGKDVATFISKKTENIPANGIFELPMTIDFSPTTAFPNLQYGLVKIKSDVVAEVTISGFITLQQNEKEKKIKLNTTQKVLFTNNSKLFLDENGTLKEK